MSYQAFGEGQEPSLREEEDLPKEVEVIEGDYGVEVRCPSCDGILSPKGEGWKCRRCSAGPFGVEQ